MTASILHLSPHMGGGVGRVLRNLIDKLHANGSTRHSILCFEKVDPVSRAWATAQNLSLVDGIGTDCLSIFTLIEKADIIHIHWWNHPLIWHFLSTPELPPCRTVIWAHTNGCHAPQSFTRSLLDFPDIFVAASSYSNESPIFSEFSAQSPDRSRIIVSTSGFEHLTNVSPVPHDGFNIGYIGTVDFCKMFPDFVRISAAANIPTAQFIVCGGPGDAQLKRQIPPTDTRFKILGQIPDIAPYLSSFDIFGYPLCPDHYGTGEQALMEAMASGIPPVVLNNGCERHIVKHLETGLIADTPDEYPQHLETLFHNPDLRSELGSNARRTIRKKYCLEHSASAWEELYHTLRQTPKHAPYLDDAPVTPDQLYLNALSAAPNIVKIFQDALSPTPSDATYTQLASLPPVFFSKTRGSVHQYLREFPHNSILQNWSKILNHIHPIDCEI